MAKFEVFIPALQATEFNVTLRVDADNWMAALKSGLQRLGDKGGHPTNIMVDIMDDNSIHVTDSSTGRVFRIKELEEAAAPPPAAVAPPPPQEVVLPPPPAMAPIPLTRPLPPEVVAGGDAPTPKEMPAVQPPEPEPVKPAPKPEPVKVTFKPEPAKVAPKPEPKPAPKPAPEPVKAAPKPEPLKPAPKPEPVRPEPAPPAPQATRPERRPEPQKPKPIGRQPTAEARAVEQVDRPSQPVSGPIGRTKTSLQIEDVFSDLFERTQDVHDKPPKAGMAFLLDLALEKITAESGSVFLADLATNDLELVSARGPKAQELEKMKLRVPVGIGIVGFCAQEAVSLAISDTQRDDRFFRDVSEKIGYETRSILCSPMVSSGRTFGCIEIINRKGSSHFTDTELAILGYVAHQGARFLEQKG